VPPQPGALAARLRERIRRDGPLTVAAFIDAALYDPEGGYYATASRRSGRAGDFVTSVDAGPLFGAALADFIGAAIATAWPTRADAEPAPFRRFDLVEAAASDGRLARDVLDRLAARWPHCYAAVQPVLVERSAEARAAQAATLGPHAGRVRSSSSLPRGPLDGILYANELLDAFPAHRLVVTREAVKEAFVRLADAPAGQPEAFELGLGPVSTPALASWFEDMGVEPRPGIVADVSPAAMAWVADAASRIGRGYLLLVDYGHEAARLYGQPGGTGTLRAFRGHQVDRGIGGSGDQGIGGSGDQGIGGSGRRTDAGGFERRPAWLEAPGAQDITAHVDFTAVTRAAERAGLVRLGLYSQTRFLLEFGADALLHSGPAGDGLAAVRHRLQARTLLHPEGMGSAFSVLLFGRDVIRPPASGIRLPEASGQVQEPDTAGCL